MSFADRSKARSSPMTPLKSPCQSIRRQEGDGQRKCSSPVFTRSPSRPESDFKRPCMKAPPPSKALESKENGLFQNSLRSPSPTFEKGVKVGSRVSSRQSFGASPKKVLGDRNDVPPGSGKKSRKEWQIPSASALEYKERPSLSGGVDVSPAEPHKGVTFPVVCERVERAPASKVPAAKKLFGTLEVDAALTKEAEVPSVMESVVPVVNEVEATVVNVEAAVKVDDNKVVEAVVTPLVEPQVLEVALEVIEAQVFGSVESNVAEGVEPLGEYVQSSGNVDGNVDVKSIENVEGRSTVNAEVEPTVNVEVQKVEGNLEAQASENVHESPNGTWTPAIEFFPEVVPDRLSKSPTTPVSPPKSPMTLKAAIEYEMALEQAQIAAEVHAKPRRVLRTFGRVLLWSLLLGVFVALAFGAAASLSQRNAFQGLCKYQVLLSPADEWSSHGDLVGLHVDPHRLYTTTASTIGTIWETQVQPRLEQLRGYLNHAVPATVVGVVNLGERLGEWYEALMQRYSSLLGADNVDELEQNGETKIFDFGDGAAIEPVSVEIDNTMNIPEERELQIPEQNEVSDSWDGAVVFVEIENAMNIPERDEHPEHLERADHTDRHTEAPVVEDADTPAEQLLEVEPEDSFGHVQEREAEVGVQVEASAAGTEADIDAGSLLEQPIELGLEDIVVSVEPKVNVYLLAASIATGVAALGYYVYLFFKGEKPELNNVYSPGSPELMRLRGAGEKLILTPEQAVQSPYGSYTAYKEVPLNEGKDKPHVSVTPVRRSNRIRNQLLSS